MGDLKSQRLILLKGWLFLATGVMAGSLLLYENPGLRNGLLLTICVWSFCRFYYFAFYVIEHYVDGEYKYAGLFDFVTYCVRGRRSGSNSTERGATTGGTNVSDSNEPRR